MVLPPKLAKLGETIEFKAAPPFYRLLADRHAVELEP